MKCDKCGICCKLFRVLELPHELKQFDDGTGKCKYLRNNLCEIYPNRPAVCNSEWVYENLFKNLSRDAFEEMMVRYCTQLKKEYGGIVDD